MGKLLAAAGCCLMLAATAAGCQQRPAAAGGMPDIERARMNDLMDREVGMAAAQAYGWNPADVVVEPLAGTDDFRCRLLGVRSPNALPSHTRTWALVDGEIVMPGTAGGLERVLDGCGDDASVEVWAEAVAAFGQEVPPGYVVRQEQEISSLAHRRAMQAGGYAFHPPRFGRDDAGGRAVEFFLTDVEGSGLYQVRAEREGAGPVQVSAELAGGP